MAMASTCAPACAASELVAEGRKKAAFLQAILGQQPAVAACGSGASPHDLQSLAEEILRCCDHALAALRGATEEAAASSSGRKRKPEHGPPAPPPATSSKRKRVSGGERATRVEKKWAMEDGFIWRKYGQKDIFGSKYPRLYFRCTYKDDHGCISYFGEHNCRRDDDDDVADAVSPAASFVINFGASTRDGGRQPNGSPWPFCDEDGGQPSGLPWPSCGEDGSLVVSETSVCHSPEEKELQSGNVSELIDGQSTPVPELTCMSSDPLDGCLVWDIGFGESLPDDVAGFTHLDYVAGLFQ